VAPRHRPNGAQHRQHGPQPHSGRNYHGVSRAAPCRWSGTTARPGAVHDRRHRVDPATAKVAATATTVIDADDATDDATVPNDIDASAATSVPGVSGV
jgi:hypothetical protein